MGRGSVGCEILGLRPELELERGSVELIDERPGMAPLELDLVNHFEGLEKKLERPVDGETERGKFCEPGDRAPWGTRPLSGGLNVSIDGAPRRGGMSTNAGGG